MTLLAMRWDKVVDFGSPMTAWTQEMLAQHREFGLPMSAWTQEMLAQHREKTMSKHASDLETGRLPLWR